MNISNNERQALFTSKLIEGKGEDTAKLEILRDLKFIKDFNQLKRDKINEIKELERLKDKLLKEVNKLRQNAFKIQSSHIQKPQDNLMNFGCNGMQQYANTVILTRVLHYLENNQIGLLESNKLADNLCISKHQAEDSLRFINKWIRK